MRPTESTRTPTDLKSHQEADLRMRRTSITATIATGLALIAAPAFAAPATMPANSQGSQHTASAKSGKPGPNASADAKRKAYGRYCKDESRKHVEGEKGTAFSRCVTAMAKLTKDETLSPRKACAGQSKKHVKGEKGTAFSRCVRAGAKLREDQADA